MKTALSFSAATLATAVIGLSEAPSLLGDGAVGSGDPTKSVAGAVPEPVTDEDFAALKQRSPFVRSLGASDSIVLTGIARIGNDVFVTVVDAKTREARLLSTTANPQGWRLVSFRGSESDIESLTAKIQVGTEVISVRYERLPPKSVQRRAGGGSGRPGPLSSSQLKEAKHAAANFREGFSADGYPRQPPREIVEKLSRINSQQREAINREMLELRNRGLGMDERRGIYVEKVNRAAGGRR